MGTEVCQASGLRDGRGPGTLRVCVAGGRGGRGQGEGCGLGGRACHLGNMRCVQHMDPASRGALGCPLLPAADAKGAQEEIQLS